MSEPTPEERKRIYEEEKARLEAEAKELTPEEKQKIYEEEKIKREAQEKKKAKKPRKISTGLGCVIILGFVILIIAVISLSGSEKEAKKPLPKPSPEKITEKLEVPLPPVVEQKQIKEFSELAITDVIYEDSKVRVTGITDLPDNSQLNVDFTVAGRLGTDSYIGVDTEVKVKNSKFMAILTPPNRPEFAKGSYLVRVMFTPRAQSDAILKLVGKDGEHLKGDKIHQAVNFKIMKVAQQIDLQLKIVPYPMVSANSYPVDSPERAFVEFLISWQKKDWNRMARFTQKTWSAGEKNPIKILEAWYGFKVLLGAEITKKNTISDVAVNITAIIYYAIGSQIKTKTISANVIREIAPYEPSPRGEWGVNASSALREE